MIQPIIQSYFPTLFLVGLTLFLIYKDKAFSTKVRRQFYAALAISLLLIACNLFSELEVFGSTASLLLWNTVKLLLRPITLLLWMFIFLRARAIPRKKLLIGFAVANAALSIVFLLVGFLFRFEGSLRLDGPFYTIPYLFYIVCTIFLLLTASGAKADTLEYIIATVIIVGMGAAAAAEFFVDCPHLMDNMISVGVCLYYFYLVMLEYKYDALTSIPNRHNLMYDFEELENKTYLFSVLDVDNFKLINDKYGHDKGDEVLCRVVETIKKHLPKQCRIYRLGGDEFAVITRGISEETLEGCFENVNQKLEQHLTRISYGTSTHNPGEGHIETLKQADMLMYQNKRLLKRDDIWDDMTGLFNLRGFLDEMETAQKQAAISNRDICLVGFDINDFENITLAYGYSEGNMLISLLADIIKSCLEEHEFVAHLGGNEFVAAILIDKDEENPGRLLAERVAAGVRNAPALDGKEYSVEINSASDVMHPEKNTSAEACVNEVLYKKKAEKEDRRKAAYISQDFSEQTVDAEEEAAALDIIENNKLRYSLQPIISAKDGTIVGYEALMRSDSDILLSPLSILRHAQKNGKNYKLEKMTFFNVLEKMATDDSILPDKQVYINSIPGFVLKEEDYAELRAKYGPLLSRVVMEITEQSELDDDELAIIQHRQAEDNFWVAIDDYGSGNSNTYSLLKIQPQIIKLDRLLITDINANAKKQYFVNSIVTFAKENGMKVLAEGVETEAELKMIIRLQVDYIQGFYTAKPSFETTKSIQEDIRHLIVGENIRGVIEGKRKIFVASNTKEITLVQIALEEYTGITVSVPKLKIVGNTDYTADMCIKIMDGLDCRLTLKDVRLSSVDELPCIELGEGANLTLVLEGDSSLDQKGIHVPEGSSLTVLGSGNMSIFAKGHDCYGIGSRTDEAIGNINLQNTGMLSVSVDGELCAAIGGGFYKSGQGITLEKGQVELTVAAVDAVGIGCFKGNVPIRMTDCRCVADFRVNTGSVIGSVDGVQSIELNNFALEIVGSGSRVRGIGGDSSQGGFIAMEAGALQIEMSGQEVCLVGSVRGKSSISFRHVRLDMKGEGNAVVAIGSMDKNAVIQFRDTSLDIIVNSAQAIVYGAEEANVFIASTTPTLRVNE